MKILLISVNRERMPFPVFPLGLAYIAMALREEGHQIEVMDLCFSQEISIDLNQTLHQFQPDLIGISLRNLEKNDPVFPSPHLLIKEKSFPHLIEGARVFPIRSPDRTLFETHRYLKEGGMGNIQTKRGCPFSCIYCTYPLLEGKGIRLRKIEKVVEEIHHLVEEGVDYVYFVDDIFNYPPSYAEALCREIVRRKFDVKWSAFVNPSFLNETLLQWMKEAGCVGIEFGTDSGSPRMLEHYKKSFTQEDIIQSSKICSKLMVNQCHYLLFGGPGEDAETIEESFHLMDQLDPP